MDATRIETMSLHPQTPAQKERAHAAKVAEQFESVFVRTLVSSLRQTSALGGEGGGMFGGGPGADVYGDWFDEHVADQIGRAGHVGIAASLMKDFQRAGAIGSEVEAKAHTAKAAADHTALTTLHTSSKLGGGIDVVH